MTKSLMAALCYMGVGSRRYDRYPIPIYKRRVWEFQVILSGSATLLLRDKAQIQFSPPSMCVCHPELPHGWMSQRGVECEVAVFHFDEVPALLPEAADEHTPLHVRLTRIDALKLREMGQQLGQLLREPHGLSNLRIQRAMMDLVILALGEWEKKSDQIPPYWSNRRATDMVNWFSHHLHEQPSVESLSRQFAISVAHIRRLFQRELGRSPREILQEVRLARAKEMLAEPRNKIETIARACGFESASAFSRAYKAWTGSAPRIAGSSARVGKKS